jgi:hypothetical protein
MRKLMLLMAVAVGCSTTVFAAFSKDDAGTATAQFLKLGAGARAAGMGEASAAAANDSTSIYWNPAGLNKLADRSLAVMHAVWFEDITYDWLSYAQPVKGVGTVGVGIQYLSYGTIKGMDSTGVEGASFTPNDLAVTLSCARNYKGIDLGASVKYISSKIKHSASAYAVDLGAQYKMMNDRLALGLAVQNLGTKMKFVDQEDALPANVKLGGAYSVNPDWLVALDINAPVDHEINYGVGTEYLYHINNTMSAAGRAGYNTSARDTGGLNGFSAGVGFTYLNYGIDYAYVPYSDLGNTQRISFRIAF